MIFISYYTSGAYKKVMEDNLLPTLEEYHLPYYIEEVKGVKGWHDGTDYKATFILDCLKKFKDDVIFIDADAQIVDLPSLFYDIPKKYDIAVHYLDWGEFWRGTKGSHPFELCTGTIMFRYNKRTISLCEHYIKRCDEEKSKVEQKVLQDILDNDDTGLKIYRLPIEYCAIQKHNGSIPSYITNPIIVHTQASRENK